MIDGLTLGAYAAAPGELWRNPAEEERWYELLLGLPFASGVELPWAGSLHPRGAARLAQILPSGWHVVASLLPHTMREIAVTPAYGLSSGSEEGRRAAIDDHRRLLLDIRRLDDEIGTSVVRAVHLNSGPRLTLRDAQRDALRQSLDELAAWDWDGAVLMLEHCDAARPGREPAKGFLELDDERAAVDGVSALTTSIGQSLNWGRSVIEGGGPAAVADHLRSVTHLTGFCFSGTTSPDDGLWRDRHDGLDQDHMGSLLTADEIRQTVDLLSHAATDLVSLAVKVRANPLDSLSGRSAPLRRVASAVAAAAEKRGLFTSDQGRSATTA